jgi:cell division protein ZapE
MTNSPLSIYNQMVERCEITQDSSQVEVISALQQRYEAFATPQPTGFFERIFGRIDEKQHMKGLYLWGGVGRGKSMLMDIFFNSVPSAQKRRVHFHSFMLEIHANIFKKRNENVDDPLLHVVADLCKDLKLICFDELQVKDIADAMILSRLFFEIIDRDVMVIFTSNRAPQDLYLHGLQREKFLPFIELLQQSLDVMEIVAQNDYRQGRNAAMVQRYIAPHDAQSRRAMYQQFVQLCNSQMPKPMDINVHGRNLHVPLALGDAAWFSFASLCEQPLGSSDYLELAQIFRYFFIENIPHLGADSRNSALRFITLVDILYEARLMLFATAASLPEYLHKEGDGSFEFARTASRLREMMSEDYGLTGS